jgi:Fe-S oxidoreductase
VRISFDLQSAEGIKAFRSFLYDGADLVLRFGGTLSGEHGDGQAKAELLPKMYGPELVQAFGEFKHIWDPEGKMNPGKVVDAYRLDQNLRLGAQNDPPSLQTHFQFPADRYSFAHATVRCIGVSRCRRPSGGTMCPSFMVTREEQHSTRGRARLLFEMLQGNPIQGWKSEAVKDALDLCLACKGCKGDCPVQVDMATYKAEFLSHYYQGRLRPQTAYTLGLIYWWARLAARMPAAANLFTQTPFLREIAKATAGVDPRRRIPAFAPQTFKQWFAARPVHNEGRPPVILWPDTFNNHFHPETAKAAVEVLEAAGYQVLVPAQSLCCGRPLYDYGMLDLAKRLLCRILETLRPQIQAGIPVIGLEPSCAAVFRDELTNLLPHDQDAQRLRKQTYLLSEFLTQKATGFRLPLLQRSAAVHGHCHHKAIMGMKDEQAVLQQLGLNYTVLDSGCCGMAGSFGFERGEHYQVSMQCGERVLLPAVRGATPDTLVIADGFSCREQIAQGTDRHALHLAEVIQLALRDGTYPAPTPGEHRSLAGSTLREQPWALAGLGALLAGGALFWELRERRRSGAKS